jgi:hypothetical protein
MYRFSVGALFKNEAHILKEWIEHYLHHGADHFFLIDDASTDASIDILTPYIEKGIVTLFREKCNYFLGRQMHLYNKCIYPHYKETEWLLMVDLDEFVWSPMNVNLYEVLKTCSEIGQIQMQQSLYGSNGHIIQPESIVSYFTRRSLDEPTKSPGNLKYFINSKFEFTHFAIHSAFFREKENETNGRFLILDPSYFVLNHYSCQSREFWEQVKCTRGDGDHYRIRTMADFEELDQNDVEDTRLMKQNRDIIPFVE